MNKKRRDKIERAVGLIQIAQAEVDAALWEEQDCLSNMPENLEGSDRYEKMESAVDNLEEASDLLNDAVNRLYSAEE